MNPVRALRESANLTQTELAAAAGTSQSAIAAYEAGTKSPTWRTLQRLAHAAGRELLVRLEPAFTREDRRSLALHRAIAERLQADPASTLLRAKATLARMHDLHPDARDTLDEWARILNRPLATLLLVLEDPSPRARELRQVTPFAGVLSARERATVYRRFAESEHTDMVRAS